MGSLNKIFPQKSKESKIIFMCKSGGRSNQAAIHINNLGYKNCYNMTSGFSGNSDGWKNINLPWRQQ
jgi:rhodanese-related sulfurtransferase